ncbi:MAG: FAD-dependent monooxygenase [Actinomycetota bacterium]|nr:FAD-dependent monooxygenase [Actinomycetota bacterium]
MPAQRHQPRPSPVGAPDTSVLVVGAGPTGLLLACALRRHGVDCVLVDAYDEPLGWDRATIVHPRSLQIFESLGVVDQLLDAGVHVRGCRIHADGRLLAAPDYTANRTRYPFDIGLSEETTERVLTDYLLLHGGAVTRSTRLVDLQQGEDRVTATLESGGQQRSLTAAWVVGCDGYRSTVRTAAGIAFEETVPDSPWAVFDTGLENWSAEWDLVFAFFDDPLVILTPLPGRRFRVYLRPGSRTADLEATALAVVGRYSPGVAFVDIRNPMRFLCHARVAERFRAGRVLLAGDAAHACSPTEGHEMNTGLQDAYNLGWKLAHVCQGEAGEALLDSYEGERRPVAVRVVESGAASDAAQSRLDEAERVARNAGVSAAFGDAESAHLEAVAAAEVDRDYSGSPIVVGRPAYEVDGVPAGRLVPVTAPVCPVDGPPRPLHELAHRLGHTVLVLGGPTTTPTEVAAVLDDLVAVPALGFLESSFGFVVEDEAPDTSPQGLGTMRTETADQLGVGRLSVLVVRPDRYVGLRWDDQDAAGVVAAVSGYVERLAT